MVRYTYGLLSWYHFAGEALYRCLTEAPQRCRDFSGDLGPCMERVVETGRGRRPEGRRAPPSASLSIHSTLLLIPWPKRGWRSRALQSWWPSPRFLRPPPRSSRTRYSDCTDRGRRLIRSAGRVDFGLSLRRLAATLQPSRIPSTQGRAASEHRARRVGCCGRVGRRVAGVALRAGKTAGRHISELSLRAWSLWVQLPQLG